MDTLLRHDLFKVIPRLTQSLLSHSAPPSPSPPPCWYSLLTWAVATQHPRLNQGCGHGDLVKQATVIIAGFLPWACDEDLHSSLQRENRHGAVAQGTQYMGGPSSCRLGWRGRGEGGWQIPRPWPSIPISPDLGEIPSRREAYSGPDSQRTSSVGTQHSDAVLGTSGFHDMRWKQGFHAKLAHWCTQEPASRFPRKEAEGT